MMKKYGKLLLLLAAISMSILPAGCKTAEPEASSSAGPSAVIPSASASPEPSVPSAAASESPSDNTTATEAPPSASSPAPEAVDPVLQQVQKLSLDEKIGQMVIAGMDGTTLNEDIRQLIQTYKIGGVILYKNNITGTDQAADLLNALKKANQNGAAPLWLSVDQEGGRVSRMPDSYIKIPTAQTIGETGDADYSKRIGKALAEEVKSLGFNLDFAPDLDINSNPDNPVIGDRSFGADAKTVITHGIAVIQGLKEGGVSPVVKHFPGHGDTSVDSHLELPVVNKTLKQLEAFELLPFKAAVENGADMVMVAHLLLPQIDDSRPASLSPAIISDLLRDQLGYEGVVITDDMTMGGIVNHYPIGEAAVDSVKAGADIVLVGHNLSSELGVLKALKAAAQSGVLPEDEINRHVYRILQLKEQNGLQDSLLSDVNVKAVNDRVKTLLKH